MHTAMPDNKKIICLAVDDEPPALGVLQKHISAMPSLELAGCCSNAVEALAMLQQFNVDLIFLDIQMPQILGTDFLRTLKNPPKVIFTTAFREFAVEGFDLDAVDYLLKPISFERFLKAVNKVMNLSPGSHSPKIAASDLKPANSDANLYFRSDRRMVKVAMQDILYIESIKDYIKIITTNGTVITKQSISTLEENLPKDKFLRIHRSFIISLSKIESYSHELIWIAKKELPISKMYKHEVDKALNSR
jgi:DNA-binding LytR/AlgR family response regulator